ncbi:MAG: CHC2 zinc finger domain-containing protein, partial [Acidobacteriota bacterium]|nr:CHC2 zinc finger domain-containing protein [Acidobacteriota bacterium]
PYQLIADTEKARPEQRASCAGFLGVHDRGGMVMDYAVDYKKVKETVSIEMVIDHFDLRNKCGLKQKGESKELRGRCPIHEGTKPKNETFSVNLTRNAFYCFRCKAKGNQVDLVAALQGITFHEAALYLAGHFKVGESRQVAKPKAESEQRGQATVEGTIRQLERQRDRHLCKARELENTIDVLKKLVAAIDKGG